MRLSEYVQNYLDETGCSQRELARRSNLSHQTISNILKDKGAVDAETYSKVAAGMNRPIYKLAVVGGVSYISVPEDNEEEKFAEYLEDLRTRPEMKMLFDSSRGMSPEQVKAIVQMIENFK